RIDPGQWPTLGVPEWMRARLEGEIQQDHTNAIGTALQFSGMDLASMRSVPLLGQSPLTDLRDLPSEASLIDHDLRNFPDMHGSPMTEDIVRLTDGQHTLDVMNVNATGI